MNLPFGRMNRAFSQGQGLAARHQHEEAVKTFARILALGEIDPRVLLHHSLSLSALDRYEESVEALEQARALDPGSAVYPLFLGVIHLDHGRPEPAEAALEQTLAMDRGNLLAQNYAALAAWEAGRPEEGMKRLLEIDFIQATHFEARLLVRVEKSMQARAGADSVEAALDHPVLESRPESIPLVSGWLRSYSGWRAARLQARAARCSEQGRAEQEQACLDLAAEHDPEEVVLRTRLAQARRKVLKECLKGLKKDGQHMGLLYKAGRLHLLLGEFDRAEECLGAWKEKEEEARSGSAPAFQAEDVLRMLCDTALCQARPRKAAACLERLGEKKLVDSYSHYLCGKCRVHLDEPRAALSYFEKLLDREPSFARLRLRSLKEVMAAGKEDMGAFEKKA